MQRRPLCRQLEGRDDAFDVMVSSSHVMKLFCGQGCVRQTKTLPQGVCFPPVENVSHMAPWRLRQIALKYFACSAQKMDGDRLPPPVTNWDCHHQLPARTERVGHLVRVVSTVNMCASDMLVFRRLAHRLSMVHVTLG